MKNSKLFLNAVLNSLGIFLYVAAVALFISNGERIFGKQENFWVPLVMILLFVFSAAITGLMFFGRPAHLYLSGMKTEAIKLILYTLACFCVFILGVFAYLAIR
ncbi:hypothetical protein L6251_00285 [Candidatus Parcubacteria bacterium]|nr:hypothetical protein [Candidatus Parcubacteria bacterium]